MSYNEHAVRERPAPYAGSAERDARRFVEEHVAVLAPLLRESHLASWCAAVGEGDDAEERSARARSAVKRLYADPERAERVRAWLASGEVRDPLLRRQLLLLDLEHTGNQLADDTIDDLVRRSASLEATFYTFRSSLDGERVTNNVLLDVLRDERDSARRREAWEASKQVGREVAEPLRELVRRRNAAARSLGFENYYLMELQLQELDETRLFGVLDGLREESDPAFRRLRDEMDATLAERYGVAPEELRPWHWGDFFGQEVPSVSPVDLDGIFREVDLEGVAADFFHGIGLPVEDVLARSDLYEREGKDQHAFCIDIDREGDVRTLCNLRPNEKWASTLLHELGHAAYDKFIPLSLPFLLRTPAHTLSTESIAMYMGRLTRDPEWLREVVGAELGAEEAEEIRRQLRASMLVSARWILVMVYFERELYRDPDRADLNSLWWDLVERIQFIRRPEGRDEPDWAAKIHFSTAPVYYHNYLLGELMASQLTWYLGREVLRGHRGSIRGVEEVGRWLRERIFARGSSLDWNELLVQATGEGLNPHYFVEEFVAA
ncbi:MAG TPA: M2 family metallopeptidase [Longimicrobiaceae bacterium]|nr:M2 family metallopeptidase [Longimicrobiaceae bacterium]